MKCSNCLEDYPSDFDQDFINGICLPCSSQAEHDKWMADYEKQLARFNKKLGLEYDEDTFSFACRGGEINEQMLKGFPILKEWFKWYQDLEEELSLPVQKCEQLNLFETYDLPF